MVDYLTGPLWLSLQLALVTTAILLPVGVVLAALLAFGRFRGRWLVESLVSLPLVLPPTVLGFYLLLAFSPVSWLGGWLDRELGLRLAFSFPGLVVASVIAGLPFLVNPIKGAFRAFPRRLVEASHTLGHGPVRTLWSVVLPGTRAAVASGAVMAFAHTMGEFGVVLMIGGNIPGETRVASTAIFTEVEALHYGSAHAMSLTLVVVSLAVIALTHWLDERQRRA